MPAYRATDVVLMRVSSTIVMDGAEGGKPRTECEFYFGELEAGKTVLMARCTDERPARSGDAEGPALKIDAMLTLMLDEEVKRSGKYKIALRQLIRPFFHDLVSDLRMRSRMVPPSSLIDFDSFELTKLDFDDFNADDEED